MNTASAITADFWSALGGEADVPNALRFTGDGGLPSTFAVTDLASAAIGGAALSIAELVRQRSGVMPGVHVDRRLASFWFRTSIRPIDWRLPAAWNSIAGDYRTNDGWIRLHTNAPHHRAAAERVLGQHADKGAVAAAVARWAKGDLEYAIVDASGCAAEMRSLGEWRVHPQGRAVAAEPLIHIRATERGPPPAWPVVDTRPLAGVRVLDLTRVLAGPVASRFLAGYGAEVLRIDPSEWNEPAVVPEVTLGKRCARLNLKAVDDRSTFEALLAEADVLLHGYRPGALASLGWEAAARRATKPGLVDVCLDAYGWTGPWRERRGFDSLVQMSAGIADAGMRWKNADSPTPLPAQALDHATGYLLAAAVVRGVFRRLATGEGTEARASLARTAKLLVDRGEGHDMPPLAPERPADLMDAIESTSWGDAHRLLPPVSVDGAPMRWTLPATDLGTAEPRWSHARWRHE